MTRGKKMLIVTVIAVLCFGGWLTVTKLVEKHNEAEEEASAYPVVARFDSPTVITSEYDGESFSLEKSETGIWELTNDKTFPVLQSTVNKLISATTAISSIQTLTEPEDKSQYGLEEPILTLTIDNSQLIFGNEIPVGDGRYMMISGDENIYIVDPTIFTACQLTQSSLLEEDEVPTISGVTEIEISGEIAYALAYDTDAESWSSNESGSWKIASSETVEAFLDAVEFPSWDCADWYADDAELETYGLISPAREITVNYTLEDEQLSFTLKIGSDNGDGRRYAVMKDSDMVFLLNATDSELLMTQNFID